MSIYPTEMTHGPEHKLLYPVAECHGPSV